jgi:hypothetical protein
MAAIIDGLLYDSINKESEDSCVSAAGLPSFGVSSGAENFRFFSGFGVVTGFVVVKPSSFLALTS